MPGNTYVTVGRPRCNQLKISHQNMICFGWALGIMQQTFVTTAPPPTGEGRDSGIFTLSPKCRVITAVLDTIQHCDSRVIPTVCPYGRDSNELSQSPLFPMTGGGGGVGVATNDWCINKENMDIHKEPLITMTCTLALEQISYSF